MAGIRVQNIPTSVTDKQLKVYFSNPKHGGGQIKQLLYPMPCSSAVIIYEDAKDAEQILLKRHKVGEEKLTIKALPRQLFRLASVEVDKHVSEFVSLNPDIVDELQFVAELAVDFSYEREAYVMSGSWYQLEWAMQHLDDMLNVYEFDKQSQAGADNPLDSMEGFKVHEIKKPNIPSMPAEEPEQELPFHGPDGNLPKMANVFSGEVSLDSISASKPAKKNKNLVPLKPGETLKSQAPAYVDPNNGSRIGKNNPGLEQGVNVQKNVKPDTGRTGIVGGWFSDDSGDELLGTRSFIAKNQNLLEADPKQHRGRPRKNVQFDPTADFTVKHRPAVPRLPRKTRGIDVSQTDFGDMPMSHMLTTAAGLTVGIAKGDITRQTTDCIVNATSQDMGNTYGVSRAIVKAVGQKLQLECLAYIHNNGYLNVTQVMHTAAGGNLNPKVKFILHTAGPSWHENMSEEATHALVCTYINCLQYADMKLQLRSISMPLISAGAFGFPLDVCVQAFYDAVLLVTSSSAGRRSLKEVNLVCFDEDTTMAVIMILQSLQDCNEAQVTQVAIDRYKSNVSQNGVGAESLQTFNIPEVRPNVRPVLGRQDEQQEIPEDVESPRDVKVDDRSDAESEDKETEARGEEPDVAYRNLSESESEDDFKAVDAKHLRAKTYGTMEAAEATPSTEYFEDETSDADNEESETKEVTKEDKEPEIMRKSKNDRPGFINNWQFDQRDVVVDPEEMASFRDMPVSQPGQATVDELDFEEFSGGYQGENEAKGLENLDVSDSDDEKDYGETRERTDDALPELNADSTDEIVAQMSSILQKIQQYPEEADDTSERDGDVGVRAEADDTSDRDGDVGVRAEGSSHGVNEIGDLSFCDSVGGSMVRVDKADVEDNTD